MNELGLFCLYLDGKPEYKKCFESSFSEAVAIAKIWANEERRNVEIYEFQVFESVWVKTIYYDDNQT